MALLGTPINYIDRASLAVAASFNQRRAQPWQLSMGARPQRLFQNLRDRTTACRLPGGSLRGPDHVHLLGRVAGAAAADFSRPVSRAPFF